MSERALSTVVSVRKVQKYHRGDILKAVEEIYVAAGGPDPKGKRILLKPNILADLAPERAVTTHPEVFRAVAMYFQSRGATILAGDSPALHSNGFSGKVCGIGPVCDELGIEWVDFTVDPIHRNGFKFARILDEVDMVISLPKLKTHELAYYTGATKNLFGLIPGLSKALLHAKYPNRNAFSAMIVDVMEAIKPTFAIMDAIIGMEGAGPQNGQPKYIGLILGSCNHIALDIVASQVVGYNPMDIPMLAHAVKKGIQVKDINDIKIEGGTIREFKVKSFKRIPIDRRYNLIYMGVRYERMRRRFDRRPIFDHDVCILCKKCIQICKAEALEVKDGKIHIHDPNCIRCYCCHEVCPVNAIEIKRKVFR
ncbi:MAG: DUF362 domain-containing protein [Candidatus Marinimicrobia bacterium]|nr:DUF362 domain-containing protein [Candidatus Neomarinimicrobiota bacterium]